MKNSNYSLASQILSFSSDIASRVQDIAHYHDKSNTNIRNKLLSSDMISEHKSPSSLSKLSNHVLAIDGSNFVNRKVVGDLCAVMSIGVEFDNFNQKEDFDKKSEYFVDIETRNSHNEVVNTGLMSLLEMKLGFRNLEFEQIWFDGSFISLLNNINNAFKSLSNLPNDSSLRKRFQLELSSADFKHNFQLFLNSKNNLFFPKLSSIDFLNNYGSYEEVKGIDTKIVMHSVLNENEYVKFTNSRQVNHDKYESLLGFLDLDVQLLINYTNKYKTLFYKPWNFSTAIRIDYSDEEIIFNVMNSIKNFTKQADIYEPLPLFIVDRLVKDISIVCGAALDQSIITQLDNVELRNLFYRSYRTS